MFKELDPELIWRAIEGQQDILTPAVKERAKTYADARCPSCGGTDFKQIPRKKDSDVIPYHLFCCNDCGCVHDPRSGVIVRDGTHQLPPDIKPTSTD